jgi:DNA-binding NarL/FixJ family response regulator
MPAGRPKPWTDAEDKRLLRMYREGFARSEIAEALGRRAESVSDRKRLLLEAPGSETHA